MRQLSPQTQSAIYKLLDTRVHSWLVSIEVRPGEAFFLTKHDQPLIYRGVTWHPWPLEVGPHQASGEGDLISTTLTLANIHGICMPYLESGHWEQGSVMLIPILVPNPAAFPLMIELWYEIQTASATHDAVTLNLGHQHFLSKPFPSRSYIRNEGFPGIWRV